LLLSWKEFLKGKRRKKDVQEFSINLIDNIFSLHFELISKTYKHSSYSAFKINDPKPRDIHKASVRDRLLHHAIYRILYPYFDCKFIYDSYSCRDNKGTHRAINRFREYGRKVSKNNTRTVWVLKCDIKKFFANIDHEILIRILKKYVKEKDTLWLLEKIIESFHSEMELGSQGLTLRGCKGLPLGNLTSQILVNIYMNEFDQFIKRKLKIKHYIRYADDFIILDSNKSNLDRYTGILALFLKNNLSLEPHPSKVFTKTLASGVDFLGWINFPTHRVLRTSTKRRMFRRIKQYRFDGVLASYLGLLSHGNNYNLTKKVIEEFDD
jgi:retron-type reverse transcriptase